MQPVVMSKEFWMSSHLSIARFYGGITFGDKTYLIVNKKGKSIFQSSIKPGEPADLVDEQYIPVYKKVGRDRFLKMLEEKLTLKEMKKIIKESAKM